jgi:hypothetical protein
MPLSDLLDERRPHRAHADRGGRITGVATKRGLHAGESGTVRACPKRVYEFGKPPPTCAQQAGCANANLTIDDVLRYIVGLTGAPCGSNAQEGIVDTASPDPHPSASPQPPTNACGVPREALLPLSSPA